MRNIWTALAAALIISVAQAAPEALLVPPTEAVTAGQTVRLVMFLNNPTTEPSQFVLPEKMVAEVVSAREQRTVPVVSAENPTGTTVSLEPMSFRRIAVSVLLPDTLAGNVSLRINDPDSNAIMFAVQPAPVVQVSPSAAKAAAVAASSAPEDLDLTSEHEKVRSHITGYEPIYAAMGFHGATTTKFQFSFKYRVFSASGNMPEWWRDMYFGYTQTSLWNLSDASKPFYDTSYIPALFFFREDLARRPDWLTKLGLQAGLQHESNGNSGALSRSLNTAFITPMVSLPLGRRWSLTVAPRVLTYLEKSENPDIEKYRGYVDLMVRVGIKQGFELTSYLRKGSDSRYGSMQLDLTLPLRKLPGVPSTVGGNLLLQYFNGWGESLRDYNKRRPDQARIGFMLAR